MFRRHVSATLVALIIGMSFFVAGPAAPANAACRVIPTSTKTSMRVENKNRSCWAVQARHERSSGLYYGAKNGYKDAVNYSYVSSTKGTFKQNYITEWAVFGILPVTMSWPVG